MSPRLPSWLELDIVAGKLGFSRRNHLRTLVNRLIRDGIIEPDQFCRERGETSSGGGRPPEMIYLAPGALVAVSAHAQTPEAAAFRREALARLAEPQAPALPAPPVVWADDTPQQLAELRARIERLEAGHAEVRRALVAPAVQLALFGQEQATKSRRPTHERDGRLLSALERLLVAVGEPGGLTAKAIVERARAGVAEAVELVRLAGAAMSSHRLGAQLREAAGRAVDGKVLRKASTHDNINRWFVESEVVQ